MHFQRYVKRFQQDQQFTNQTQMSLYLASRLFDVMANFNPARNDKHFSSNSAHKLPKQSEQTNEKKFKSAESQSVSEEQFLSVFSQIYFGTEIEKRTLIFKLLCIDPASDGLSEQDIRKFLFHVISIAKPQHQMFKHAAIFIGQQISQGTTSSQINSNSATAAPQENPNRKSTTNVGQLKDGNKGLNSQLVQNTLGLTGNAINSRLKPHFEGRKNLATDQQNSMGGCENLALTIENKTLFAAVIEQSNLSLKTNYIDGLMALSFPKKLQEKQSDKVNAQDVSAPHLLMKDEFTKSEEFKKQNGYHVYRTLLDYLRLTLPCSWYFENLIEEEAHKLEQGQIIMQNTGGSCRPRLPSATASQNHIVNDTNGKVQTLSGFHNQERIVTTLNENPKSQNNLNIRKQRNEERKFADCQSSHHQHLNSLLSYKQSQHSIQPAHQNLLSENHGDNLLGANFHMASGIVQQAHLIQDKVSSNSDQHLFHNNAVLTMNRPRKQTELSPAMILKKKMDKRISMLLKEEAVKESRIQNELLQQIGQFDEAENFNFKYQIPLSRVEAVPCNLIPSEKQGNQIQLDKLESQFKSTLRSACINVADFDENTGDNESSVAPKTIFAHSNYQVLRNHRHEDLSVSSIKADDQEPLACMPPPSHTYQNLVLPPLEEPESQEVPQNYPLTQQPQHPATLNKISPSFDIESEQRLQNRPFKQVDLNNVAELQDGYSHYEKYPESMSPLGRLSNQTKELTMKYDTNDDYSVPGSVTPGRMSMCGKSQISDNKSIGSISNKKRPGIHEEKKISHRQQLLEVLNRSTSPQSTFRRPERKTLGEMPAQKRNQSTNMKNYPPSQQFEDPTTKLQFKPGKLKWIDPTASGFKNKYSADEQYKDVVIGSPPTLYLKHSANNQLNLLGEKLPVQTLLEQQPVYKAQQVVDLESQYNRIYYKIIEERAVSNEDLLSKLKDLENRKYKVHFRHSRKEQQSTQKEMGSLYLQVVGPCVYAFANSKSTNPKFIHYLPDSDFQVTEVPRKTAKEGSESNKFPVAIIAGQGSGAKQINRENKQESSLSRQQSRKSIKKEQLSEQSFKFVLKIKITDELKRVYYLKERSEALQIKSTMKLSQLFWRKTPSNYLDKYTVLEGDNVLLGKGSFGKVYKGRNKATNELVAIKNISRAALSTAEQTFIMVEMELLRILSEDSHPGIVRVFDIYDDDPQLVTIVMECIEGGSLQSWILSPEVESQQGQQFEKTAKRVFRKMVEALEYLHAHGIVHRDIKLENVILQKDPKTKEIQPKLIDFGLSQVLMQNQKSNQTVGSIAFLSPEIVGKKYHNQATDIWSMGVVLYVMLTGRIPFIHPEVEKTMLNIQFRELNFQQTCWEKISAEAKDLVSRMLWKEASSRATIQEVLSHKWLTD
ncbi:hypothetical protein FGO68_gene13625 [Halteria grandinella]|uniref:Protein kinase domain-containing protein n=1 Tax=Halteria grandinella TaxID=5974 RepID=A0A8J8P379_HALGN|nr:hypothetical protein FGO68_gene13625 [Halteria grandinella]